MSEEECDKEEQEKLLQKRPGKDYEGRRKDLSTKNKTVREARNGGKTERRDG